MRSTRIAIAQDAVSANWNELMGYSGSNQMGATIRLIASMIAAYEAKLPAAKADDVPRIQAVIAQLDALQTALVPDSPVVSLLVF